jgi:hypothetical protein
MLSYTNTTNIQFQYNGLTSQKGGPNCMRLSVIKYQNNETVFYNPGVFQKSEDLIIFPFKEFDKFYNETVSSLNVVKHIIEDSLNPESTPNPLQDLRHIEDWIKLIQEDLDLLIKFDVQTRLSSFNNRIHKKIKTPKRVNEISVEKEEIQCLIGL